MESGKHNLAIAGYVDNIQEIAADHVAQVQDDERRQCKRRAARWTATITTRNKEVVQCRTRDISEKGASIATPYDFNMNALIVIELKLTYKDLRKTVRVLAEVRHRSIAKDGFTIGVFFKDASAPAISFFRKYANGLI